MGRKDAPHTVMPGDSSSLLWPLALLVPLIAVGAVTSISSPELSALALLSRVASLVGPVVALAAISYSAYIAVGERAPSGGTTEPAAKHHSERFNQNLVTHHSRKWKQLQPMQDKKPFDYDRWDKVDWEREAANASPAEVKCKPYMPAGMANQANPKTGISPALEGLLKQLVPTVLSQFAVKKYAQHGSGFVLLRTSLSIGELQLAGPDADPSVTLKFIDAAAAEKFYTQHPQAPNLKDYLSGALDAYDPRKEFVLCIASPTEHKEKDKEQEGTMSSMRIGLSQSFEELEKAEATYKSDAITLKLNKPTTA